MVPPKWVCLAVRLLLSLSFAMSSAQRSLLVNAMEREANEPTEFRSHRGIKGAWGSSGYGGWPSGGDEAGQGSYGVPTADMGATNEGDMPGITVAEPSPAEQDIPLANQPYIGDQPVNGGTSNPSAYNGLQPGPFGSVGVWQGQAMYCTPLACQGYTDKSEPCQGFDIFIDFLQPPKTRMPPSITPWVGGYPDTPPSTPAEGYEVGTGNPTQNPFQTGVPPNPFPGYGSSAIDLPLPPN